MRILKILIEIFFVSFFLGQYKILHSDDLSFLVSKNNYLLE